MCLWLVAGVKRWPDRERVEDDVVDGIACT